VTFCPPLSPLSRNIKRLILLLLRLVHLYLHQASGYFSRHHVSIRPHTPARQRTRQPYYRVPRPCASVLLPSVSVLHFCTGKASKLKFTVFFANFHSDGFQKPCNGFYRPYFCLQRTQDRLASVFAPYVRIRQHSSAYVSIRQHTESPDLVRQYSAFSVFVLMVT
jgi:hypothetical protein